MRRLLIGVSSMDVLADREETRFKMPTIGRYNLLAKPHDPFPSAQMTMITKIQLPAQRMKAVLVQEVRAFFASSHRRQHHDSHRCCGGEVGPRDWR